MLLDLSTEIRNCHEHAERCRRLAREARDPEQEADYLELEKRWLKLAQSYEHTERITRYLDDVDRKGGNSR